MLLYWYACISMNNHYYVIYHMLLEMVWWALSNASLIMWICSVIHEILVDKDFTVTDDLISWLFVVTFVHPTYVQIALIWGFIVQLSLWKSVHWLWKYKLNKVCDTYLNVHILSISLPYCFYKVNMFSDIIVLDSSTTFQTYDLISCDTSCDCSHVSFHCLRKQNWKSNQRK